MRVEIVERILARFPRCLGCFAPGFALHVGYVDASAGQFHDGVKVDLFESGAFFARHTGPLGFNARDFTVGTSEAYHELACAFDSAVSRFTLFVRPWVCFCCPSALGKSQATQFCLLLGRSLPNAVAVIAEERNVAFIELGFQHLLRKGEF